MIDPMVEKAIEAARAADPPTFWLLLFIAACYAMAAGCIYRGIREGARARSLRVGIAQCVLFVFLVGAFWFVESWAHHRTPFYLYSAAFPDLLRRFPLDGIPHGVTNACTRLVLGLADASGADRIPLSVLLMEASLTYAALWTARHLGAKLVVQPFLAGLVLVNVDALLDPVVATSHSCADGALLERPGIGLGFWRWYAHPSGMAEWYGVPVFNYAAWFAAPLFLVALVNLGGPYFRDYLVPRVRGSLPAPASPAGWQGILLLTMMAAIVFLFSIAPNNAANLSVGAQNAAMAGVLGFALIVVGASPSRWKTDRNAELTLVFPAVIAIAVPAVALLAEGFFVAIPGLILVGIGVTVFGLFFTFFGCRRSVRSFYRRVRFLDRLIRLHYFGFTAMLTLLGAALFEAKPMAWTVSGLLLVALCFHVWSYVLNDVVDLELDREQRRREGDPLVSGQVSRESALAFALVQVPLAALVALHLLDFDPRTSPWALPVLVAGFLLILVYNLWGRVSPFPPLTDLAQGLGWGCLVVFGGLVASPHHPEFWERTTPLIVYAAGYILLVSGVHGGLRDLVTDREHGRRTTALFFGARPSKAADGEPVESSRRLVAYAFAVHTLMFLTLFVFLLMDRERTPGFYTPQAYPWAWVLVASFFVVSSYLLWRVVRSHEPRRDGAISGHLLVLLLPPLLLYQLSWRPDEVFQVLVLVCFFVPLSLQEGILGRALGFLYRSARPLLPNGCGLPAAPAPDQIGPVEWEECCNLHDLAYWEGGIRGGLLPWKTERGWEWRYIQSNLGLARCMAERWGASVGPDTPLLRRWSLRIGQVVVPVLYLVATTLLGWIAWSWERKPLRREPLEALSRLSRQELERLEPSF
jgi:4-hydroxybenzoate polyprenyltransferase